MAQKAASTKAVHGIKKFGNLTIDPVLVAFVSVRGGSDPSEVHLKTCNNTISRVVLTDRLSAQAVADHLTS